MAALADVPDLEIGGSSSDDELWDESFTSDDSTGSDEEETLDTDTKRPDIDLVSMEACPVRKEPLPELNLLPLAASSTIIIDLKSPYQTTSWADLVDEEDEYELFSANSPDLVHIASSPSTTPTETRPSTSRSTPIAEATAQSDERSDPPFRGAAAPLSNHHDRLQVIQQYALSTLTVLRTDWKRLQSQGRDISWLRSNCHNLEVQATYVMKSAKGHNEAEPAIVEDMLCCLEAQMDDIERAYSGDQDHIRPAPDIKSEAITEDHPDPDSVEIIAHKQHHAAASIMQSASTMSTIQQTTKAMIWNDHGRVSPLFRELMKVRLERKILEQEEALCWHKVAIAPLT